MTTAAKQTADTTAVIDALRAHDRFVLTTHENPDGDALGSLLGAALALRQLGKEAVMVLPGDAPLPQEYLFLGFDDLERRFPDDLTDRVVLALDCASASRVGGDADVFARAGVVIDVDHHHDNTRFGTVNLIDACASSTGELLWDVLRGLGVRLTPEIAEALYVAIVTDTGRFQYSNTTPKALRLAADLVEAGAETQRIFQHVYESVELAKLKLIARALDRAQVYEGGALIVSYLTRADFTELGAPEAYSEGIIDYLRAVDGADMAALIREPPRADRARHRISLRASIDELDVSAIARKGGGGGHRQAAGFSSDGSVEEITEFVRREFAAARA